VFDIRLTSQIFAVLLADTSMETAIQEQLIELQNSQGENLENIILPSKQI